MLQMLEGLPQEDSAQRRRDQLLVHVGLEAEFQQLQQPVTGAGTRNIELLMDVDLPISIELGRTKMSISTSWRSTGRSSSSTSSPANGRSAREPESGGSGRVVVVDENFGLRITSS